MKNQAEKPQDQNNTTQKNTNNNSKAPPNKGVHSKQIGGMYNIKYYISSPQLY